MFITKFMNHLYCLFLKLIDSHITFGSNSIFGGIFKLNSFTMPT